MRVFVGAWIALVHVAACLLVSCYSSDVLHRDQILEVPLHRRSLTGKGPPSREELVAKGYNVSALDPDPGVTETEYYKQQLENPTQVSVVIMNWKRPQNVKLIIQRYKYMKCVKEIIILMCNPETSFTYVSRKVRIVNEPWANEVYGLSTRFKGCLMARSPWVLIQDDDHMAKATGIRRMLEMKKIFPNRLLGPFSRGWPEPAKPQYLPLACRSGTRPIVLTIMMLADRATCQEFWNYAPLVEDYVREHSVPMWNGEDIFYSLVSYKTTGQLPLAIGVKKVFLPQRSTGIHFGSSHDNFRDEFVRYAIGVLNISYEGKVFGVKEQDAPEIKAQLTPMT